MDALDLSTPEAIADAIADGHEDLPAAAYRTLALAYSEALAELNRRDAAADTADRARRELDRCGAAPGWLMTLRESGAI